MLALLPYLFVSLFNLVFGLDEAELLFAGDAMQHEAQLRSARCADGTYDFHPCFEPISQMVKAVDYAVVNLETPIGTLNFSGYPCFNAPVSYAEALRDAGFDMMLTANNHTLDRRHKGLRSTIAALDSLGVEHLGTYTDVASRQNALPFVKNISGIKVGFLNYTYGTNGIAPSQGVFVDYIDRDLIATDIAEARRAGAEVIVVAVHWGDEYHMLPNKSQRDLADFLIDYGVDVIIGGHPHVIQPMEMRHNDATGKDVLLVYSLGNFISNMKTRDTRGGAVVKFKLSRGNDGVVRVCEAAYRLVFTEADGGSQGFRVVPVEDCADVWHERCRAFEKAAEDIFEKHNVGVARGF